MRKKMVMIGAGSAVFTKGLVLDVIERTKEKWHIALVDIDEHALETIRIVCQKMIAQKEADVELSWSTDRRDVLGGADYVVSTIGVGGRRAWEQDVFIPRKYGVYQPVGDTIGPGGISRAMRMIPQLVDIANDIKELCPKATFFNYSNPMTMNCMGIRRATGVPVIGLCHGVKNGLRRVAKFLDIPQKEIQYTATGLNHMVFCYHMRRNGEDLIPYFVEKLDNTDPIGRPIGRLTADSVRYDHAYVVSDDRHFSEFVPATTAANAYYGVNLGMEAFSFEGTIAEGDAEFGRYERYAADDTPLPDEFFEYEDGEHEQLLEMIGAIHEDRPSVYYVNMPNNGAVPNLPDATVIERPALFSGSGIQPVQLNDFPTYLLPPMMHYAATYEVAVTAALTGDVKLMECAVAEATIPLGREAISKMVAELLEAHKEYLPQFH